MLIVEHVSQPGLHDPTRPSSTRSCYTAQTFSCISFCSPEFQIHCGSNWHFGLFWLFVSQEIVKFQANFNVFECTTDNMWHMLVNFLLCRWCAEMMFISLSAFWQTLAAWHRIFPTCHEVLSLSSIMYTWILIMKHCDYFFRNVLEMSFAHFCVQNQPVKGWLGALC